MSDETKPTYEELDKAFNDLSRKHIDLMSVLVSLMGPICNAEEKLRNMDFPFKVEYQE